MKKQIKTSKKTVNNAVYPTIKKLSLAMTILNYIFIVFAIVCILLGFGKELGLDIDVKDLKSTFQYAALATVALLALMSLLSVGEIVLAKKVSNVTPKISSKKSITLFSIGLAFALLGGLVLATFITLLKLGEIEGKTMTIAMGFGSAAVVILASLMLAIVATIVAAQVKTKK